MSETEENTSAPNLLRLGHFDAAWDEYGRLLELFPEDIEYQCGLYTAGYWRNRREDIQRRRAGRELGSYLYHEWDSFQELVEDRGYQGCLSFRAAMQFILGTAADEFRLTFQEEGGRSVDVDLLIDLGKCLIRIEDYANAVEILNYTRRIYTGDARVLFLLGESLCSSGAADDLPRGLAFYRDAFLKEPEQIDPTLIASSAVAEVFEKLYEARDRKLELVLEWLPAHIHAAHFSRIARKPTNPELDQVHQDAERLAGDLHTVVEKYREKTRARLAFYILVLLHDHSYPEKDKPAVKEYEKFLKEIAPEVREIYDAAVKTDED